MSKVKRLEYFDEIANQNTMDIPVNPNIIYTDEVNVENNTKTNTVTSKVKKSKSDVNDFTVNIDPKVKTVIEDIKKFCNKYNYSTVASQISKIENNLKYNKFKVAVVGEFSRGKSTLINKIFEEDILPMGDLPTTAMLTKVSYNEEKRLVYVNSNGQKQEFPLSEETWDKFTVDFTRKDPTGIVFIGSDKEWLKENNIEIMDTPGAGDLDKRRATLINESIIGSDGVVITISALAALSSTEELFIRERILAQRFPHLTVVLTRLDQVKAEDRKNVVSYVRNKLNTIDTSLPLAVTYDFDDTCEEVDDVTYGVSAIKEKIIAWANDEENQKLKNEYIQASLANVIKILSDDIENKEQLVKLDVDKQKEVIEEQRIHLANVKLAWEDLHIEMMKRCSDCVKKLEEKIRERGEMIVEQLQYESSHSNNLQNWWENDYPFKVKTEMMKISMSLDAELNKKIEMDVLWLNGELSKRFKEHVSFAKSTIADKDDFKNAKSEKTLELEDLSARQTKIRVGTGVASIAGYVLLAGMGPLAIVTSIGMGLFGTILSQNMFKKKIEEQRKITSEAIAKDVPQVIDSAIAGVEKKLIETYDQIVKEASEKEKLWYDAQIESLNQMSQVKENKLIDSYILPRNEVEQLAEKILLI